MSNATTHGTHAVADGGCAVAKWLTIAHLAVLSDSQFHLTNSMLNSVTSQNSKVTYKILFIESRF